MLLHLSNRRKLTLEVAALVPVRINPLNPQTSLKLLREYRYTFRNPKAYRIGHNKLITIKHSQIITALLKLDKQRHTLQFSL